MENKNIMIIGVGFHARRIYIPTIEKLSKQLPIKLAVGVDLESRKDVIFEYLNKTNYNLDLCYVDSLTKNLELSKKTKSQLDNLVKKYKIEGVIISTEPLTHNTYANWALDNRLNILMDKPITIRKNLVSDAKQSDGLLDDFKSLLNKYLDIQKHKETIFTINTQRRYDTGFNKVIELISEVKDRFNIPVTSIQAMYADGTWVFPYEILNQSSHPYKHGYGKYSHSGYHILDIVWQFYLAGKVRDKYPDNIEVYSSFLTPKGFNIQISDEDYKKYFQEDLQNTKMSNESYANKVKEYGEIDAFSIFRLKKGVDNICNISINVMHNSFSRRAWGMPNKDLYKGNGRVKHQQYIIEQGPFQCIQIHNYQANDSHDKDNSNEYEVGGNNHFDIYVFRNSEMFGECKPFQKISNRDLQTELSNRLTIEQTKDLVILEFLNFILGKISKENILSNIETHKIPVTMLSSVYKSNAMYVKNKNSLVKVNFESRPTNFTNKIIDNLRRLINPFKYF